MDWLEYATIDLKAVQLLCDEEVAFPVCKSKLAETNEPKAILFCASATKARWAKR